MKWYFRAGIAVMMPAVLFACGGGGSSSSQKTGMLTMGAAKDSVAVKVADAQAADPTTDVTLEYSAYKDSLTALPVVIDGFNIRYERQDCADCPTPLARSVSSGISLKAGDTKTQTITLLTAADKQRLPLSAVRADDNNPILSASPVTPEDHSVSVASGVALALGQVSPPTAGTFSMGAYDGKKTAFSATLQPPLVPGTLSFLVNGTSVAVDNGRGAVSGSKGGTVQAEQIGTGDGSSTSFSGAVYGGLAPGSITVKVGGSGAATDNSAGGFSNPRTVAASNKQIAVGDGSTLSFQGRVDMGLTPGSLFVKVGGNIVAADDNNGHVNGMWGQQMRDQLIGTADGTSSSFEAKLNGPVDPGSIVIKCGGSVIATGTTGNPWGSGLSYSSLNPSTGALSITMSSVPAKGTPVTVDYQYTATITGNVNYGNGWVSLVFSQPPASYATVTADYTYAVTVSGTVSYTTGKVNLVFSQPPAIGAAIALDYTYNVDITGTVSYQTGAVSLSTGGALHSGDRLSLAFSTSNSSAIVDNNTLILPAATFAPGTSQRIVRGTVALMLDDQVIGRDNGNGGIVGQGGASGTVDYQTRTISARISPVPATGVLTAYASLESSTGTTLTPTPIVSSSVAVKWGDVSCSEKGGQLQYPCVGTVDRDTGAVQLQSISNSASANTGSNDVVMTFKVDTAKAQGGEFLGTGDGSTNTFALRLKYAPIAPPSGGQSLTIVTSGGLTATDMGSGVLKGDTCAGRLSTVDYSTGVTNICFSRALKPDEGITAFYRTSAISMKAIIEAQGHEVGGSSISLTKSLTITVN